MNLDLSILRPVALVVIVVLIYGSRLTKGSVKTTAEGMVFRLKPMVVFSRIAALVVYLAFFAYLAVTQGKSVPAWFYVVFALAIGLGLLQFPGTIVLEAQGLVQRFWFLKEKRIAYPEVMTVQRFAAGRAIRVLGDHRTVITHTNNHAAADEFLAEVERRTGKTVQR